MEHAAGRGQAPTKTGRRTRRDDYEGGSMGRNGDEGGQRWVVVTLEE